MLPDIAIIKRKRLSLGLTQLRLSKLSGVSQSLIAKMENGLTVPSYYSVKRIIETLERLEEKDTRIAEDIMTKKVITLMPSDSIKKASEVMREFNISQIPIFENQVNVGSISESDIASHIFNKNLKTLKVKDIMNVPFPQIQINSSLKIVREILKENHAVLIYEKDKLVGIITQADFLRIIP